MQTISFIHDYNNNINGNYQWMIVVTMRDLNVVNVVCIEITFCEYQMSIACIYVYISGNSVNCGYKCRKFNDLNVHRVDKRQVSL